MMVSVDVDLRGEGLQGSQTLLRLLRILGDPFGAARSDDLPFPGLDARPLQGIHALMQNGEKRLHGGHDGLPGRLIVRLVRRESAQTVALIHIGILANQEAWEPAAPARADAPQRFLELIVGAPADDARLDPD
ncbi:MAG TPA: hypothetical protein PKE04_05365 [Clostridia bacterium]|nr:hypothetical protein [Clostridia bacterium]